MQDLAVSFRASLARALEVLLAAIPRVLGFALILIVGWVLSALLARGVAALLRAVRFEELARRSGFAEFVRNTGVRTDPSGAIGAVAKWFVRLVALVVAFDMLGLPAVSVVLQQLLLWLPNLIVALVVLVLGGLAANALAGVVRGAAAEARFTNPDLLATVTRIAVWALAVVVAVSQLGIATAVINTLLIGVVGALALASGLAFGLGGRNRAAQILDSLGRRAGPPGPRLEGGADDLAFGAMPAYDPSWVARSGIDRRRVARLGADRRLPPTGLES